MRTLVTWMAWGSRLPSLEICQNGKNFEPSQNESSYQRDGPGL